MRNRRGLAIVVAALVVAIAALPGLTVPAAASPTVPRDASCPFGTAPGPAVDASEAPVPGQAEPAPLPVPEPPIGGAAMGGCGDVVADGAPAAPATVTTASYVLADLDSGQVLAARNAHARLRPASLMKVLTGLLVAHRLPLDEVLTGTADDANQEGTRVGMGPGGQYTTGQLLDAMLMASGNDAAHALSVRLTGSVPATVDLMNDTARRLGALDTRAATPSGLDGPGMQTSAYDLASIFRVAMREPAFATATGTRAIPFPGFGGSPPFQVDNDNKLITTDYPGALGGKTGFTDDARHTYIGAAERDGRRLVAVLLRGEQTPVPMYQQGAALLDYGFALPGARGVGTLTDGPLDAPAASSNPESSPATTTTAAPTPNAAPAGSSGSTGTPLLIVAIVAAVLGFVALRFARR